MRTETNDLAMKVRLRRAELGWSRERLAKEAGLGGNTVYRLEHGNQRIPRDSTLYRIAIALNLDPADLIGGSR